MIRSVFAGMLLLALMPVALAEVALLNLSYDVTRKFYKEFNPAFVAYWKGKAGETVIINQSHGGSSKQARSVVDGLDADVVTMNQANDVDLLAERGKLLPADWAKRFPYHSAPYTSTTVILVRKGNPKHIRDWDDLVKPGVAVVVPNPKTSGNGRYSYLAAWGYVVKKGGSEQQAKEFVTRLFKNVPVLDAGGRGATTTFVQRGIGDALLTFENEVFLTRKELGSDAFDVVYPSISIQAENPVSVVDKVVDKRGTRKVATAYLEYLYSEEEQELAAKIFSATRRKNPGPQRSDFQEARPVHGRRNVRRLETGAGSPFQRWRAVRSDLSGQISKGGAAMAEYEATHAVEDGQTDRRLSTKLEQEILCAIARIDYSSIEVVVHDGKVVQIECREKIRVVRDEPGRKGAVRQIR